MPEFGKQPLGGTIMSDEQPDQVVYPKLRLVDSDASVIPIDMEVGTEFVMMTKVRLSETSFAKDGSREVMLEVLEGYPDIEESNSAARTGRMYPSMGE